MVGTNSHSTCCPGTHSWAKDRWLPAPVASEQAHIPGGYERVVVHWLVQGVPVLWEAAVKQKVLLCEDGKNVLCPTAGELENKR